MKKIIALCIAMIMVFSLVACGETKTAETPDTQGTTEAEETAETPATPEAEVVTETTEPETPETPEEEATPETPKKIVMGCSADFPPFEFYDLSDGNGVIAGMDVLIANEIAKDYGAELEIKDLNFDTLIGAMQAGQIDMIASGMNASDERKKQVDFSTEYFFGKQVVLVQKSELENYKKLEDLSGKKIGVQLGSLQEGYAETQIVPHGASILGVAKVGDIVMQLKIGAIAGVVIDKPIAEAFIRNNDDLAISEMVIEGDDTGFGIAVSKDNGELLASINSTIERLLAEGKIDEFFTTAVDLASAQEAAE